MLRLHIRHEVTNFKLSNKRLNPPHPLWGWFCIILGVIPLLVGLGIIQADQPDKDAPIVIISLPGLIFLISVIMILIDNYLRAHFYCAVLICLCFAVVSGWATITASPENIFGGLHLFLMRQMFCLHVCYLGLV